MAHDESSRPTADIHAANVVRSDRLRTVLFDLDGTLADTAPDLAYALNCVLRQQGRATLPYEVIRPVVSHGGAALISLGFGLGPDHAGYDNLREELLRIYKENLTRATTLFPGMAELLDTLEQRGMNWGVVTNKPSWLTDPLMAQLGLRRRAACIVSGDTTANRKPHPEPMLHACQLAGSSAPECLYVGDAERDIEAGRRAGMHTLVALFGYIDTQDTPGLWGADALIRHPLDVLAWIDNPDRFNTALNNARETPNQSPLTLETPSPSGRPLSE
jgi:2-phosphoglycolate phosphatase